MACERNSFLIMSIMLIILMGILAVSNATSRASWSEANGSINISHQFEQWMTKFGRTYENNTEKEKRFSIFKASYEEIENFKNKGNKTYTLGLNQFSDMTDEEFVNEFACETDTTSLFETENSYTYLDISEDLPQNIDWRDEGFVTPVKNQAQGKNRCGCCWAFTALAAVEAIYAINWGKLTSLSVQQLVDCDRDGLTDKGCKGGLPSAAFEYIVVNNGVTSEDNYKYHASDGECDKVKESTVAASISGYRRVPPNNELELVKAVANQPVAASVWVDSRFKRYTSGIFFPEQHDLVKNASHSVTIVGYNKTPDNQEYWILKNSWGEHWGENGYMRIRKGVNIPQGVNGLYRRPCYPIIA